MAKLRIIGDTHGHYDAYIPIAQQADYSIQVGDMGFDYERLKELDPYNHVFIMGNHDNYDKMPHLSALDKFGMYNLSINKFEFFYVRGGFSIDWRIRQSHYLRTGIKTYWDDEELSVEKMRQCLENYKYIKPEFVITHECPRSISRYVGNNDILKSFGYDPRHFTTRTSELLEAMFQAHQPQKWIFGHYHRDWSGEVNGTHFTCLGELSYMELEI